MGRPFLTARWSHLVNVTWAVPVGLVQEHVPAGVQLDLDPEGRAFVSLVGFDFRDTRVWGVAWPGYRDFPELNLRTYVSCRGRRGVVFLREYVPYRLIAWIARWLYGEPYRRAPMRSQASAEGGQVRFQLELDLGGRTHRLEAVGRDAPFVPEESSQAHWFKEHHWGFGRRRRGTIAYAVDHPVWATWPVESCRVDLDFGLLYGPAWAFLADAPPLLSVFAVGSEVAVHPRGRLESVGESPG